ncbi:6748_t:CDS:2 [Acaulospora morrowiae]|uniref:Kinetochore protein Spc24 n=1 Tax=Acaulospora morrowiae TaxID=94023 RepID=A0A9N9FSV3_9GLOM|nr:6748_t:CDS:2 [Acaulospora morrowiae]
MERQKITSQNIVSEIISLKKKFSSNEDIETIREIQENVRKIEDIMSKKSEQTKNELKALNRKLKTLKNSMKRPAEQDERDFQDMITKHEREKFNLDKSIASLTEETKYPFLCSLETLQNELEELENTVVEDVVLPQNDATSLQLHIYRSLGIQFIEDPSTHKLKARIEGPNDIHTVMVDDRHTQYFIANYLWELSTGSK